jgi:hypothetical protein
LGNKDTCQHCRIDEQLLATQAISLNFVAIEQVVLIALGTVGALQTTNQEYGHTNSDKDGEDTRVDL